MKKLAVVLVLCAALAAGVHGMNTAYRNTRALGYGKYTPPFAVTTNENGETVFRIYDYVIDLNGIFR